MNEKNNRQYAELWDRLKVELITKGPASEGSLPSKAESILEMVAAMLFDDHIFAIMRLRYFDLLLPPHPDFGKKIKAAKRNGTFPQVVDVQIDGAADELDAADVEN